MIQKFIPITKTNLGKEEVDAVTKVVRSGNIVKGKTTQELEISLCKKFKRKYALFLSSGTASLNTALTASGINEDDEVITTPFTFIATANAINYIGAKVVFADIDPKTFNIDPDKVINKITKNTKAIIAVNLFGLSANYRKLSKIAKSYKLLLIEDAAQSLGAIYKNKPTGSFGDISIFSFYGSKIVTSGEGGALLTNNRSIYNNALAYSSHGTSKNKPYTYNSLGYNFLPTDIQAALLIPQLNKIDKFVRQRNKIAKLYSKKLSSISSVTLPKISDNNTHAFNLFTIRLSSHVKRNSLLKHLNQNGILARIYYPMPLHLQPVFRKLGYNFKKGEYPEAESASREVISLPIYPQMSISEVEFVISKILENIH